VIKAYEELYPLMIEEASAEGVTHAETAFSQTREVKTSHSALTEKSLEDRLSASDPDYYICQICGYISESRAPERCPVCGAIPGKFKLVS
jgi:rubrerythrin